MSIEENKQKYLAIFNENVHRDGSKELLEW